MRVSLIVASLVVGSVIVVGESIYDGTGSLINSNQVCWGCDRDEAMMHPHKNKNSTVTFQVLYNSAKCTHINIHSDADFGEEVLINLKSWDKPSVKKSYKAKLPVGNYKYKNGVSVKMENWWTTLAISSAKPINKDISIYAYCRSDATDTLNKSDIYALSSPLPTKLDNNHYHLGNGSLISLAEDNGQSGYGTIKDEAITSNSNDAETSFQILSSKDKCEEVTIRDKGGSSKFEKILFKGWSEKDWKNSDCTKLPCVLKTPLQSNGKPGYTLINIKTKAGENSTLYASCGKKKIKFNLNEKENRPKHPNDCKFSDVPESHWANKYVTALCSAQILEGYKKDFNNPNYIQYSRFGIDDPTLWQELTKVVNLADNFYKTKKIRNTYPAEPWGTAYVDIAKIDGFTEYGEMKVTRGLAFKYIVKVFWGKTLSEEKSASFLKSKQVIGNTNITNYLTRAEMAKTVLRSSRFSADDSGLERKLPYVNHGDKKLEKDIEVDKDIPTEIFETPKKNDSDEKVKDTIEKNRQKAEKENTTFSEKGKTDNSTLAKEITNIKKELKDKSPTEIKEQLKAENKFESNSKFKANQLTVIETPNNQETLGVTGEKDKTTGEVKITIETKSGEVKSVSESEFKKAGNKVIGGVDTNKITDKSNSW